MGNLVITGCSSGIGLATAQYLKERFVRVYPTARKPQDVQMLKDFGFENAMQLDVTNAEQISAVIASVMAKEGHIDAWFNNAGYGQPAFIEDLSSKALEKQFQSNVLGLHECTIQVLPIMRKQNHGIIIQHSSVLGIIALASRGAYNASKYAIEGLTDTLRIELQDTNIYPVLLNTGPISSDFRKNALKKLSENVDIDNAQFKENYLKALNGTSKKVPFNEEAISVAKVVHKILLAKKPKPRYYITKATYLLGYLKRLLSTSLLDKILARVG